MNIKIYISFIVTIFISLLSYGQDYNKYCLYTDYSVKAYKAGNYEQAIALMDSAINQCKEQNNDAANWYNLSLFYKKLYKQNNDITLRKKMLTSILYAQGLDHTSELEKPIKSYIKTLANYYFKDAVLILDDTSSDFSGAIENYNKYKSTLELADSNLTFKTEDIEFYSMFAQRNNLKFENNKVNYANHADSAILYYTKTLDLDSTKSETYNALGLIYFNQAVELVNNLSIDAELDVLMETDIKKADLALKSIPIFTKAFQLDSSNSDFIYSLAGSFKLIEDNEQYGYYLNLLKEKDPEYYKSVMTFE